MVIFMLSQIISSLAEAATAAADWFVDFLTDGLGIVGLSFVLGMVFLSLIYRFIIAPAFIHAGNVSGSLSSLVSGSSDSVRSKEKPHPDFSEKG